MQRDFKIGMALGLLPVIAAALWLSARPALSTKERYLRYAGSERNKALKSNKRPAESNKQRETRFHIIREDDTLYGISNKYYGSANKWRKIFDANREIIKDANKLQPGTKLIIPR